MIDQTAFSITASDILEYLYCPRFIYFENYLDIPQHQEKRFKVQKGRDVHDDKQRINPAYLRKKLGCIERKSSVYLSSARGIRGIVDEILFLDDGSAAPLDYKYAEYKERTIQDNYNVAANRGFIVYTRSRNKLIEVPITEKMYLELDIIISDLTDVVQKGIYPKPTRYKQRCPDCCYRNLCERTI
ncbi:MAG: CRISPR-associated protein Cas4 [Deltaproteobacteria bacterium]|nr:CRISPR-associated protein Cas4 [Deltaproteobacteria bacterium]